MIKQIALIAVIAWLAWATYQHRTTQPIGVAELATAAPALAGAPVEEVIPQKHMKVSTGEPVKRGLHLSEKNITDKNVVVVAASTLGWDSHPREIITTLNTETGGLETVVVRKELPWFEPTTRGDAMLAAGLDTAGNPAGLFQVRQAVVNVKDYTLGVVGQVSHANGTAGGTTDAAAMVAIWRQWGR